MSTSGGRYPISQVEDLARRGRVVATLRVAQWLSNHGYDVKLTILEVLASVESCGQYIGSCTLMNGATADEYVVALGDEDWYLKFWLDDVEMIVNVWSCCWDGVVH